MSTTHRLDALHGDNPLGFLAALGALVTLSRREANPPPRLAWEAVPPHRALLSATTPTPDGLAEELFIALTVPEAPTPRHAVGPRRLKELTLVEYRQQMRQSDESVCHLLAGLCSDVTDKETVRSSPLVMMGGPQDYPSKVKETQDKLAKDGASRLANALFGPWEYVAGHPLGFDPLMERSHAYLAEKPGRDNSVMVPGAVLLAAAALAALPLFPVARRSGCTNALFKDWQADGMLWPVWDRPLSLPAVVTLLSVFRPAVRWPGVAAAYACGRVAAGKEASGYYVLRAGRRLW